MFWQPFHYWHQMRVNAGKNKYQRGLCVRRETVFSVNNMIFRVQGTKRNHATCRRKESK